MIHLRDTLGELRNLRIYSSSDQFMRGGHRIINSNRAFAGPHRKEELWTNDEIAVRELLLRVFPKLDTNEKDRLRAGRWARLIHLYFKSGLSQGDVANEMKMSKMAVNSMLRNIRRASKGGPCNKKLSRASSKAYLRSPR